MSKVLIIEDDEAIRDNLLSIIEYNGFEAIGAENGREGIYLALRELPDLIFCDILMPSIDGYDVFEVIRNFPATADIPFVFLTALADRQDIRRGMNLGADDYLTKPYTETEVIDTVSARLYKYGIRHKVKILVIEDEDDVRGNLVDVLEYNGFDAIGAKNGEEGLKLAADNQPDIILCDVRMPGLSGYDVLDAIRRNRATEQIPFIFLTAVADKQGMRRGMNLGADDYITKPYTQAEIVEAIHSRFKKHLDVLMKREEMRHKFHLMSNYDDLTKLPNRKLLMYCLDREILWANRKRTQIAAISIGIDRFREINKSLGYEIGDMLLKEMANRIGNSVSKTAILSRVEGDKFFMIIPIDSHSPALETTTNIILSALSQPFQIREKKVHLTASMGISAFPDDGNNSNTLLNYAEIAMQNAKDREAGSSLKFAPEMISDSINRREIEEGLRQAVENDELLIYYQPQVDVAKGEIIGVEALLRWRRPGQGMISPEQFIPIAEETGMIIPIGKWVLHEACRQMKMWHDEGFSGIRVAVNLSALQLHQKELVETISNVLSETRLDPSCLELEPTESMIMQNIKEIVTILNSLKAIGIRISIDDFGTGYSSLNYLNTLPLDKLKIDQSFVGKMTVNANTFAIVQTIIALGHVLNLKVIAEGIENGEQLDLLRQNGCDEAQGYYFSEPLPAAEITQLLHKKKLKPAGVIFEE